MKDIKGFEGKYAVTSCGKVWSYKKKNWMALNKTRSGYYEAVLWTGDRNHKKHIGIHRLVLSTYNPVEGMENFDAAHIDDDKSHNYLNNLHWVTHKDNLNEGSRNAKISGSRNGNHKDYQRVG